MLNFLAFKKRVRHRLISHFFSTSNMLTQLLHFSPLLVIQIGAICSIGFEITFTTILLYA